MLNADLSREVPALIRDFDKRNKALAYQIKQGLRRFSSKGGVRPIDFYTRLMGASSARSNYETVSTIVYLLDKWDMIPLVNDTKPSSKKKARHSFDEFLDWARLSLELGVALNFINASKPLTKRINKIFNIPTSEVVPFLFSETIDTILNNPSKFEDPYKKVVLLKNSLLSK